jgi:putative drug exporter of the RND superfamily
MSTPPKGRLAAFAGTRRGRWIALAAWAVLAAVAFTLAPRLGDLTDDSQVNWLPVDAESTRALNLAEDEFDDDGLVNLVVLYTSDAPLTGQDVAAVEAARAAFDAVAAPGHAAIGPIPSEGGRALMLLVPYTESAVDDDGAAILAEADAIAARGLPDGLDVGFTGAAAFMADAEEAFGQLDGPLLWMTVAVVALVLLFSYRSPLLLVLPLLCIGIASQVASALAYLLGEYAGVTINNQNTGILTVLVFGASTNYTLLLVSRYREELRRHERHLDAMAAALPRIMPAVLASAATVVLALAVLPLASVASIASLGPVLIAGVVSAVAIATTLLPAVLTLFGRAVFWPAVPRFDPADAHAPAQRRHRIWGGVARLVSARPRTVAATTAVVLAALTVGWAGLSTEVDESSFFTTETESQRVGQRLAEHYPAGMTDPVEVYARDSDVEAVVAVLESEPGIAQVAGAESSPTSDWVRVDAVLTDDPSGQAARDTVAAVRDALDTTADETLVGGATATRLDLSEAGDHDLRLLIPLIVAVVLAVVAVLLRAVVAALVLTLCTVLSFATAIGAAGIVLNLVGHATVDTSFFLFGFLFLVAMGVDYTIFLMTRAREEVPVWGHRVGVLRALTLTGGVITSAGLVLAATFLVLAMMPLTFLMQIGVVVALGVAVDAIVVRSLLAPSLALWIGERFWWPGRTAGDAEPVEAAPREPIGASRG